MSDKKRRTKKKRVSSTEMEGGLLDTTSNSTEVESSVISTKTLLNAKSVGINCFKEVRVDYPIHLPPSATSNPLNAVMKVLGGHLMKYSRQYDGVAISIISPKLLQPSAGIISDQPYIHFAVTSKFLVFSPPIGSKLVGVVHHIGFDYIGLLVLGTLNVSIYGRNLPHFIRDIETDCWNRNITGESISEGTKILFTVKEIHKAVDSYSIVGSMADPGTGILNCKEDGTMELIEHDNLNELIAKGQADFQVDRSRKKTNTNRQTSGNFSEYESNSEFDNTPVKPQVKEEPVEVKKEKIMDSTEKVKLKKRRRSSTGKTPKPKKQKTKKDS